MVDGECRARHHRWIDSVTGSTALWASQIRPAAAQPFTRLSHRYGGRLIRSVRNRRLASDALATSPGARSQ